MKIELAPLSELLEEIVDNRGRTCPTAEIGIPLIATNCIKNDSLYPVFENVRYVSKETYETWFRGHPEPGDIIFVNKGTPGRVCMVPNPIDFCIAQDMVALRANQEKVYPKYLFAVLRSPEIQSQVEQMHVGTLIPHFKKGDFDKFLLPVLDWDIQKEIGDFYFNLSAKIELNRRMNATLEAMAQALFKSWFVDFDPVTAKAEGRVPFGMSAEMAALFPAEFIDAEFGAIPKGWKVGNLSELAKVNPTTLKSDYQHKEIEYIDIASVEVGNLTATTRVELKNAPSRAKRLVKHGDTIWSCVRPNRKSYLFIQHPEPNIVVSTGFAVLSPKIPCHSFLYLWVTTDDFVEYLTSHSEGSAYPAVRPDSFENAPILIPPADILSAFEKQVKPLFELRHQNERQSRTLASIRDVLLPRLLSGEARWANGWETDKRKGRSMDTSWLEVLPLPKSRPGWAVAVILALLGSLGFWAARPFLTEYVHNKYYTGISAKILNKNADFKMTYPNYVDDTGVYPVQIELTYRPISLWSFTEDTIAINSVDLVQYTYDDQETYNQDYPNDIQRFTTPIKINLRPSEVYSLIYTISPIHRPLENGKIIRLDAEINLHRSLESSVDGDHLERIISFGRNSPIIGVDRWAALQTSILENLIFNQNGVILVALLALIAVWATEFKTHQDLWLSTKEGRNAIRIIFWKSLIVYLIIMLVMVTILAFPTISSEFIIICLFSTFFVWAIFPELRKFFNERRKKLQYDLEKRIRQNKKAEKAILPDNKDKENESTK